MSKIKKVIVWVIISLFICAGFYLLLRYFASIPYKIEGNVSTMQNLPDHYFFEKRDSTLWKKIDSIGTYEQIISESIQKIDYDSVYIYAKTENSRFKIYLKKDSIIVTKNDEIKTKKI